MGWALWMICTLLMLSTVRTLHTQDGDDNVYVRARLPDFAMIVGLAVWFGWLIK